MKKTTLIPVLLLLVSLTGCAVNPVTGKNQLSLVSEAQELEIGRNNYAPLRQSQGGDYVVDRQLTAYVSQVGERLAAVSDRELPYEFKVLNNSVPNAWALPGGKISINRGLLVELESEAELAAVLGHEIVHAAAKHTASSMSRGMLIQGAVMATVVGTQGKDYAQLASLGAGLGAQLVTQKYGRDAERESDFYGMQYMSKAGYDPQGAVDLQQTFVRLSEGKRQDWLSGLFASHPPSQERVDKNIKTRSTLPPGGEQGKQRYQATIAHLKRTKPAYEAYDKGRKALQDEDMKSALSLAKKAIALEPKEAHFHALLGDIEASKKRYKTARGHYTKAIELNDGFFYNHLMRGQMNEKLKASMAAKQDLQKSIELLPTANAYTLLGNIAEREGDLAGAKTYYAKAASNNTSQGKLAYRSLMEIDLQDNPQKYIKLRSGLDKSGRLKAELSNPTPADVKNLAVTVRYRDTSGVVKSVRRSFRGELKAGEKRLVDLGFANLDRSQLANIKASVSEATLSR